MFSDEEWVVIKDFPQYLVSSHGRVKHRDRKHPRQIGLSPRGFPVVLLSRVGTSSRYLRHVNKLVAEAFLPPPALDIHKPSVRHIDRDLTNCHYSNLEWVSRSEVIEWNRMSNDSKAPRFKTPPVRNNVTGTIYPNAFEAGKAEGIRESALVAMIEGETDNDVSSMFDKTKKYSYFPRDEYLRLFR